MENREQDSKDVISKLEKESESSTNFGKDIGRSENISGEPSRKSGSSGMLSERGRSRSSDESLGSESELSDEELEGP